ncbi:MAG: hypothetical protein SPJ13_08710, partial [Bacteroidales bacterium]|nr:hypothetical protein [Bacteroidales bacterium]
VNMFKYHTKKIEMYYNQVIEMYLAGCSTRTIFQKTKVSDETIRRWIRIFANENSISNLSMKHKTNTVDKPHLVETDKEDIEKFKDEIKQLKRQLEDEQLRSKLYARMIEITERELNISITKKAGARR